MDVRMFGLENPLLSSLHHLIGDIPGETEKNHRTPTGTYVRDARAMASTPADVKELPAAYIFIVDMPGVRSGEIKVQIEDDNVLVISGERKREDDKGEKEEGKYLRMERRMGKFMRKFSLPENTDLDKVTAECKDGLLTVTVMKKPPPEPKTRTVQVKVA